MGYMVKKYVGVSSVLDRAIVTTQYYLSRCVELPDIPYT